MSGWEPIALSDDEEDFNPPHAKVQKANNGHAMPPKQPPSWSAIPSFPNSLWDVMVRHLKAEDSESLVFFHFELDANENSVEVFLNDKRYFLKPERKLPCDIKHAMAKYIFQQFDHGDVKYPFEQSKVDNVMNDMHKWDASNAFIRLESDASFEECEKTEDNVTVLLEIDDEEVLRTMASSMELARNIASKQMLNSDKYKQKYIDLLKKEASSSSDKYELSGPVIEKFGNPRNDQHIAKRLANKDNVHLDVIWRDYGYRYLEGQITRAAALYGADVEYHEEENHNIKGGQFFVMLVFNQLCTIGIDYYNSFNARKVAQCEMVNLLQKYHDDFKVDIPLRNWEILGKADRYECNIDFTQHIQLFNFFDARPKDEKILQNKWRGILGETWAQGYFSYQLHKASLILKQELRYESKTAGEAKLYFGDYMHSVGCGRAPGQARMCAQAETFPYIEAKYKYKFDDIAIKDWMLDYTNWLVEKGLKKKGC